MKERGIVGVWEKEQVGLFAFLFANNLMLKSVYHHLWTFTILHFYQIARISLVYCHFFVATLLAAPMFFAFHWLSDTWYFSVQLKCFYAIAF